jgi:hypothetical protein
MTPALLSATPPPSLAITTLLVALAAVAGCNAMTGADDLTVGDDSQTQTRDSTMPRDRSATADGGVAKDGSANRVAPKHPLECDGRTCDGSTPFCCQRSSGRATCVDAEETCEGALLACAGPDDCRNGDVCCAMPITNVAACLPAAGCAALAGQLLCEHDDECPGSKRCSGTSKSFDHSVCD